ncbi:unnamed protein product [Lampetra planeri]
MAAGGDGGDGVGVVGGGGGVSGLLSDYADAAVAVYSRVRSEWSDCSDCGVALAARTLRDSATFGRRDAIIVVVLALAWITARILATSHVFKPLAAKLRLRPQDVAKFPENAWKLVFYLGAWLYSGYLLFMRDYNFFAQPLSAFTGWYVGMEVPSDIHLAYMLQGSFYLHSVYGTLCLDTWRRDSPVMILHHIITLSLIGFSYALRFHNIGLLVLFLHDTSDFLLEFTKVNVYLRHRGGGSERERWVHARIADLGCAAFGSSWFVCRLYWFPLKVVHTTAVTVLTVIPNMPFYFLFNSLLIILTGMNVYWFSFIVAFVAKVLTGQMKEVDDLREFDVNERVSTGPEGEAATQGERRSRAKRGKGKGEAQENGLQSGGGKKQQ